VTLKCSTIFIAVGEKTRVYKSVDDVPPRLRKRLTESTNGLNSATILIADRNGRDELMKAINGRPSNLRIRSNNKDKEHQDGNPVSARRYWPELIALALLALAMWLLAIWK